MSLSGRSDTITHPKIEREYEYDAFEIRGQGLDWHIDIIHKVSFDSLFFYTAEPFRKSTVQTHSRN